MVSIPERMRIVSDESMAGASPLSEVTTRPLSILARVLQAIFDLKCLSVLTALGVASFGCRTTEVTSAAPACLVVASDLSNPPFAFVDADGRPAGQESEMLRAIAADLGYEIEWRRIEFGLLIEAVRGGEVDLVCATMGVTEKRAKEVDFSQPYFSTQIAAVVRRGPGEAQSLADLVGARVSAARGTTSEDAVREALPRAQWIFDRKEGISIVDALETGSIDAAVMDGPNAEALAAAQPGLRVLPQPLAVERYAIAVAKGNDRLRVRIDAAIRRLRVAGRLPSG